MEIYVNGCSLTFGACDGYNQSIESNHSISWPKQLEKNFNIKVINESICCSGNDRIIRKTIEHIKNNYNNKDNIFVWICWSGPDRFEIFSNNEQEVTEMKNFPWAGKDFEYDGVILNINSYWYNRFNTTIFRDTEFDRKAKEMLKNIPELNSALTYKIHNQNFKKNVDDFAQKIILLQSFLEKHNIKYGMSFAFKFPQKETLSNNNLIDKNVFYDFDNDLMGSLINNGFKQDPTKHFYPDGYEFYGQQIANFIKENYNL